jgi:hypothetical protein
MNPANDFRKNAAQCRELASTTPDHKQKTEWLKLAEEWERMATAAHARPDWFDAK